MVCEGVIIINKGAIVAQGPIDNLVEQFFPNSRVLVTVQEPTPAVRTALGGLPG